MLRVALLAVVLVLGSSCSGAPARAPAAAAAAPAVEVPLSPDTLEAFLRNRFAAAVADGTLEPVYPDDAGRTLIIDELALMGVTTTGQLAAIIPADFDARGLGALRATDDPNTNLMGLVRDLLIIHDVARYQASVWRSNWTASGLEDFPAARAYGVPDDALRVFSGGSDDDDGDDGDDDGED